MSLKKRRAAAVLRPGLGELVVAYQDRLTRRALRLTGDPDRARDVVQNVFTRATENWERVSGADNIEAYLNRMVDHAAVDEHRKHPNESARRGSSPTYVGDATTEFAERDAVRLLLAELATQQRAVVMLKYLDDLSEREIARALGLSIGTVKSHNARALNRLRELIVAQEEKP